LYGPVPTGFSRNFSTPTDSMYFFGTMKLPRNDSHCGEVGAGALNFTSALVGDWTSMSVTLPQEFLVSTACPALMRSRNV
jgi:hypothetical protein